MVDAVLRAVDRLRRRAAEPLAQGLRATNARACLDTACAAITAAGLHAELATVGQRPDRVAIVCAYGVYTSPLEWAALFAAAGCSVHLKAPARDATFVDALVADLVAEGLPVTGSIDRDLGEPDAVVAFGDDETMVAVAQAVPHARRSLYGHRFSVALLDGEPTVQRAAALARDAALYDGRGCMAPTAVFVTGDASAWADALAVAMAAAEQALPRGAVDPSLGPEWRRRLGLARVRGSVREGSGWAVPVLPPEHFTPLALPRMLPVHPVADLASFRSVMQPLTRWLSSCATDDAKGVADLFPRTCRPGTLQTPPFPRLHDGRPMLGSILG